MAEDGHTPQREAIRPKLRQERNGGRCRSYGAFDFVVDGLVQRCRAPEDVVKEAEQAAVLVLVY